MFQNRRIHTRIHTGFSVNSPISARIWGEAIARASPATQLALPNKFARRTKILINSNPDGPPSCPREKMRPPLSGALHQMRANAKSANSPKYYREFAVFGIQVHAE
jgi:hypothetical protein